MFLFGFPNLKQKWPLEVPGVMPHPGDPGAMALPGVCPAPGAQGRSRCRGMPAPRALARAAFPGSAPPPPLPGSLCIAQKLVGWSEAPALTPQMLASLPSPPQARWFFFVSELSRAFCEFSAVRLHRVGLGRVGFERQARSKLQQARPGGGRSPGGTLGRV